MDQLPALYTDCAKCGGTKVWTQPPEQHGSGRTVHFPQTCPACQGVGIIPTADGRKVLDLVTKWQRAGRLN